MKSFKVGDKVFGMTGTDLGAHAQYKCMQENSVLVTMPRGATYEEAAAIVEGGLTALNFLKHKAGIQRRLDIAASLLSAPDLLVLDEPATGLDPRSCRYIWDVVHALRAAGTTVLLTIQYLEEADELADRIVIIDQGTIIADGAPSQLKASVGSGIVKIRLNHSAQRQQVATVVRGTLGVTLQLGADPTLISAPVINPKRLTHTFSTLAQAGIDVAEFAVEQPSLDEIFLTLTQQPIREQQAHK